MIPNHRCGDDGHSLFVHFLRIHIDRVGDHDHRRDRAFRGIQPEIADAARDDQPDVAILEAVGIDGFFHRRANRIARDRDRKSDRFGRREEPVQVLFAFENPPVVDANAFEYAVAVKQTVVVDADLGVGLIVKLSVDPDFQLHCALTPHPLVLGVKNRRLRLREMQRIAISAKTRGWIPTTPRYEMSFSTSWTSRGRSKAQPRIPTHTKSVAIDPGLRCRSAPGLFSHSREKNEPNSKNCRKTEQPIAQQ